MNYVRVFKVFVGENRQNHSDEKGDIILAKNRGFALAFLIARDWGHTVKPSFPKF